MPKRPDVPCAECGTLMWRGRGSLPSGLATCLPCRRAAAFERGQCKDCSNAAVWYGRCENCAGQHRARVAAKRASRSRGQWISPSRRYAIYARDAWLCWVCGNTVNQSLIPIDDYAASLDHVIPRSWGGTDTDNNLRLAHRICNTLRWCDGTQDAPEWLSIRWCIARPKGARAPKRQRVQTQASCALCESPLPGSRRRYCSDACMREMNARAIRDQYRVRVGLRVDPAKPTRPTRR